MVPMAARARRTAEEGAELRLAILDAALRRFAEHGYRGTTVAAIAADAGITDAGVLYHFKTKEDLLIGALGHFDRTQEQRWKTHGLSGRRFLESVGEWGVLMESEPAVSSLLIVLSAEHLADESEPNAFFRRRYENILRTCREAFEAAAEDGDLRADLDAGAEASALVAHIDGIRLQWFFTDGAVSMARSVRSYVTSMLERLEA